MSSLEARHGALGRRALRGRALRLSAIEARLERIERLLERQAAAEVWPKSVAQFAAHVQRSPRQVQSWIEAGKLRVNREVRPCIITEGAARLFLEGNPLLEARR